MELIFVDVELLIVIFFCKFLIGGILGWVGVVCFIFNLVGFVIECYYVVIVFYCYWGKFISGRLRVFIFVSWMLVFIWVGFGFFIIIYIKEF